MRQSQSSIQAVPLSRWAEKVLLAKGVRPADATRVVEVLVTANLRAVDSHGVFTCLKPYLARIDEDKINLEPELRILRDQGATVLLDGDQAFGQVGRPGRPWSWQWSEPQSTVSGWSRWPAAPIWEWPPSTP